MQIVINCPNELACARIVAALKREDLRLVSRQKHARIGQMLFDLRDDAPPKPRKKSYELVNLDDWRGAPA